MRQITPEHLAFVNEAAKVFEENPRRETHWNKDQTLIALRFGRDRDCILVHEFGPEIALFAQQVDVRYPEVREEVYGFAREMELQIRANEHKGGWENSSLDFLISELLRNVGKLKKCLSHEDFRRRCANIANFAMMLADNDRREELERR